MWSDALVTDAGLAIFTQWAGGEKLTLTKAKLGGSTVSRDSLSKLTNVSGYIADAKLIRTKKLDDGIEISVRLEPLNQAKTAKQIGIFGKLGNGAETLLAIYQDTDGVEIPSIDTMPEYVYNFYAVITTDSYGELTVNIDASTHATLDDIEIAKTEMQEETNRLGGEIASIDKQVAVNAMNIVALDERVDGMFLRITGSTMTDSMGCLRVNQISPYTHLIISVTVMIPTGICAIPYFSESMHMLKCFRASSWRELTNTSVTYNIVAIRR